MSLSVNLYNPRFALVQKLIAALFLENYGDFKTHCRYQHGQLLVRLDPHSHLVFACQFNPVNMVPYTITDPDIFIQKQNQQLTSVSLTSLMSHFVESDWWPPGDTQRILSKWHEVVQTVDVLANQAPVTQMTDLFEWLALVIDRPNHPFAHAKASLQSVLENWTAQQVQWWAFPKEQVFTRQSHAAYHLLLTHSQQQSLQAKLADLSEDYIALPLLASQAVVARDISASRDLEFTSELGLATSSLRTFCHPSDPLRHIKMASSATPLGAMRTMPPRYLYNGDCAHALLQEILLRSKTLARCVKLCDERQWWSLSTHRDMLQCKGEIGVQLRCLPSHNSKFVLSMAALNHPYTWHLLAQAGVNNQQFFTNVCQRFVQMGLLFLYYGVAPECHGQNIILYINDHDDFTFVLRDHDSLRICPSQLEANQLALPDYQINWHTPNTLVLPDLTELAKYFITLGLQVNLYPIAKAMPQGGDEQVFWRRLYRDIEQCVEQINDDEFSAWAQQHLLHAKSWPFKAVLAPLFGAADDVTGMPSAMSTIANPLASVMQYPQERACDVAN
ncbi:IucA/IucC family protein [Pseudoalteromonas sp. T1lg23B]|uniref:IucA/IucC family protein n=1 Tax=Pseudoalteromonas sp. T1lg23B TaxID=2077097 RepID=UPI000CF605BC|nr:IucA/IucC family protein [Pseudoalteromonas sp. T1lg23B]